MFTYIHQSSAKLIIFLIYLGFLTACNASTAKHLQDYKQAKIILPSGEEVKVYIAETMRQQRKGLSGIRPEDFSKKEGMLFPEKQMFVRQFWMPETYFDLDLIFMNADYYVLEIHRGLKHYPHKPDRGKTPFSKKVFSQHVLELRADSPLAKKIKPGMVLRIKSN